jgi:hypothetical protein
MYGFDEYELYIDEYSIEEVREDLGNIVKFFQQQDYHEHAMKLFIEDSRELPLQVAKDLDAFCVDENMPIGSMPEWMQQESLGFIKNKWVPMWGRCVFPVKDVHGSVMGFCGWDPFAEPKYLDSKNYGYKAKATTLFGMEKLPEYYVSKEPIFVTEGLMCTAYLRSQGFQALASLGSHLTPYVITILQRFGSRLIMVPDNDDTGDTYIKQIKRCLPKALIIQCAKGKDIEGLRKLDEHVYEEKLLKELKSLSNPFVRTDLLIRR